MSTLASLLLPSGSGLTAATSAYGSRFDTSRNLQK
jgi:hypothetical protein